jgi:hypothetical protein
VLNQGKGYPRQEIISSVGLTLTQDARGHVLTVMLRCEFSLGVEDLPACFIIHPGVQRTSKLVLEGC